MRGNEGCSFFRSAVHIDRYGLAVPVQLFGSIGVIMDIDNDLPALLETQQRSGENTCRARLARMAVWYPVPVPISSTRCSG